MNRTLSVVIGLISSLFLAACSADGSDSRQLAEQSTAHLLVPTDESLRGTWSFHVEDSPNNYTFRSNWSASFDPAVDQERTVVGYQVNDSSTWSGGAETGSGQAEKDAVVSAVTDSLVPSESASCQSVDIGLQLVACRYDVDSLDGPLEIVVRRFADNDSVLMAVFADESAADYLSGDFETVAIEQAIEQWLTS